jgi:hypothetical protein
MCDIMILAEPVAHALESSKVRCCPQGKRCHQQTRNVGCHWHAITGGIHEGVVLICIIALHCGIIYGHVVLHYGVYILASIGFNFIMWQLHQCVLIYFDFHGVGIVCHIG